MASTMSTASSLGAAVRMGSTVALIGAAFETPGIVRQAPLGDGMVWALNARTLIDFAVRWIGRERA